VTKREEEEGIRERQKEKLKQVQKEEDLRI